MVHMRGYLFQHVVNTVVTIIIDSGFDGLSRVNKRGGYIILLNPLYFFGSYECFTKAHDHLSSFLCLRERFWDFDHRNQTVFTSSE